MQVLKKFIVTLVCPIMLCACSHKMPNELSQISGLRAPAQHSNIDDLRANAIKETAASLGAQSALAWRAEHINNMLDTHTEALSQVFNFKSLLLRHNVLPPVLSTSENIVNIGNDSVIRVADKMLTILLTPRFVTAAPTWQHYMLMHFKTPETPNTSLLPKTREETAIWNKYIVKSWHFGVQQANHIFNANLARLKRDFNGMVLYRKLLAQHMVTAPYVAETTLGVTGNSQSMRLNDRILRIASTANLITDTDSWDATLKHLKIDHPKEKHD